MVIFDAEFERELFETPNRHKVIAAFERNAMELRKCYLTELSWMGIDSMELFVKLYMAFYPDVSQRSVEYLYFGFSFYETDLKCLSFVCKNTTKEHVAYIKKLKKE